MVIRESSNKLKVLYIVDSLGGGGAERVVADLAKNICRNRFIPMVCTTREPGVYVEELAQMGIRVDCLYRKKRFDIRGLFALLKLISDQKPQIIHTHKVGSNTLGRIAGILAKSPVLIAHEHTDPQRNLPQRIVDNILARKTAYIVACDNAMKQSLTKGSRLDKDKVVVVHNGIDLKKFDVDNQSFEVADSLNLLPGPKIGCFARLEPQKDIMNLLLSVPFILEKVPDANILIAGEGPQREEMERLAINSGVSKNVRFLGHRKDIPRLLAAIDLLALSSSWEGLPLVLLEAMASKKPVVCTDVGGVSEIVEDGFNGLLVPPKSPKVLGDAITALLLDKERAREMGRNGYERVNKEFSLEEMVIRIEDLYLKAFRKQY